MRTVGIKRIAVVAAAGLLVAAFAGPGDPIPGTEVGLEHDPEGIVAPRMTDDLGRAEFAVGEGRAGVLLPAVQTLRVPAVARVEVGRTVQVSAPIMPGGRGRAEVLGTDGRRLVVVIPRGGGHVRVTLSVWDDTDIVHRQVDDGRVGGPLTGAGPAAGPRRGTPLIPRPQEDRR